MKKVVSYSELRDRRRCPYKGYLNYDRRLSPVVKSPGFREGSIIDAGLNALYNDWPAYNYDVMLAAMREAERKESERIAAKATLFEEEWQVIREKAELLEQIAAFYVDFARANDNFDDVITTQLEGRVPVLAPNGRASTRYDYQFKADGLVVIDGRLWLLENKAWKTIDSDSIGMLSMDEQCGWYLWGLDQMIKRGLVSDTVARAVVDYGCPVGVLYNIIRKKMPSIPNWNKGKTVKNKATGEELYIPGPTSVDKSVDTTHAVYLATLLERGQDPADYAEMLDMLQAKGDTFHVRETVYRNADELEEIGQSIYAATRFLSDGFRFRVVDRTCSQCAYKPLCLERSDELESQGYYVRERVREQYEELEEVAA